MDIAIDRLRERLRYDAAVGDLIWLPIGLATWDSRFAGKPAGTVGRDGYVYIKIDGVRVLAHRCVWALVTGSWPKDEIDHINGSRTANRFENLREATREENSLNRGIPANNRSGAKGVSFNKKSGRWVAYIGRSGRRKHLGYFSSIKEAAAAYDRAAADIHGQFAKPNLTIEGLSA